MLDEEDEEEEAVPAVAAAAPMENALAEEEPAAAPASGAPEADPPAEVTTAEAAPAADAPAEAAPAADAPAEAAPAEAAPAEAAPAEAAPAEAAPAEAAPAEAAPAEAAPAAAASAAAAALAEAALAEAASAEAAPADEATAGAAHASAASAAAAPPASVVEEAPVDGGDEAPGAEQGGMRQDGVDICEAAADPAPDAANAPAPEAAAAVAPQGTAAAEEDEEAQPQQRRQQGPYARFREMLMHPSAKPVIARLQGFVKTFPEGLPRRDAAALIHKFLSRTQEWMLAEVAVFMAESDEEGRTNAAEGLEKFLLSRLHERIFATDASDREQDEALAARFERLAWVGFEHLGVPPVDPSLLRLAVSELERVNTYKAPRDKLVCILNASRVINDVLKITMEDSGAVGRPLSADDFLPLLIYSVLTAKPPRLHANVEFIAAFRHPSRLHGEDAYFLTALQSAAAFVRQASAKELGVSEEEFERRCAESLAAAAGAPGGAPAPGEEAAPDEAAPAGPPTTVEAKAAALTPQARQALAAKVGGLSLRFEAVPSARQLHVDDVPLLLREYLEMAALLRRVDQGLE